MKYLSLILLLCCPLFAFGQTSPPDEITLPPVIALKLENATLKAEVAKLKTEIYQLKAQAELTRIHEEAKALQDAFDVLYLEEKVKAGIPRDLAEEYEGKTDALTGVLTLKRRTKTSPNPSQ